MGKNSSKKRRRRAEQASSKDKGDLLEAIVAGMHDVSGVEVATKVQVPTIGGSARTREIDVLLTGTFSGYPIKFAIECRNEGNVTGEPKIDGFVGKLHDIGIPTQCGIYVCVRGYTKDAQLRAEEAGIKLLTLQGLSDDRLSSQILRAMQSVIHCLLSVTRWEIRNSSYSPMAAQDALSLIAPDGQKQYLLPDMVWRLWVDAKIPLELANREFILQLPSGWYQLDNDQRVPIESVAIETRVTGLMLMFQGQATRHILLGVPGETIEKVRINASFARPSGSLTLTTVASEEELDQVLRSHQTDLMAITRFRLPRIHIGPAYWPPSERTALAIAERMRAFEAGDIPDPRPLNFAEIEGTDLSSMWEPIWPGHAAGNPPSPQQA